MTSIPDLLNISVTNLNTMGAGSPGGTRGMDTWYYRTIVQDDRGDGDMIKCCAPLATAVHTRAKYRETTQPVPHDVFLQDLSELMKTIVDGPTRSTSAHRLQILQYKYDMHALLNHELEEKGRSIKAPNTLVTKIDNHTELSHLCSERAYHEELFPTMEVEDLEVLQGLNPVSAKLLSRKPFAEFMKHFLKKTCASSSNKHLEISLQFTGLLDELVTIAQWMKDSIPADVKDHVRWILCIRAQLPSDEISTKGGISVSAFVKQLFEAISSPIVAEFMATVGAITVKTNEHDFVFTSQSPEHMKYGPKTCGAVFLHEVANAVLAYNLKRKESPALGEPLSLRFMVPTDSQPLVLLPAYLLCDAVVQAYPLIRQHSLHYLFYLTRIQLILSTVGYFPMEGRPHPILKFIATGMRMSIATMRPAKTHFSEDPLREEYAKVQHIASNIEGVDILEICRQSVLNSTFPSHTKAEILGLNYKNGISGNEFGKTLVPNIRLLFREECMLEEYRVINTWLRNRNSDVSMPDFKLTIRATNRPSLMGPDAFHATRLNEEDLMEDGSQRAQYCRQSFRCPPLRDAEAEGAALLLHRALTIRNTYAKLFSKSLKSYMTGEEPPSNDDITSPSAYLPSSFEEQLYLMVDGVMTLQQKDKVTPNVSSNVPTLQQFCSDVTEVLKICQDQRVVDFSNKRLNLLQHRFHLHVALNATREMETEDHRDFYQTVKVDNHVHMAAGMTARMMLDFILEKWYNCGTDIVDVVQGRPVTLNDVLNNLGVQPHELTVHHLGVQATDRAVFERFDTFNDKYSPMGKSQLRTLFLKTDNYMGGRYFAELCKQCFSNMQKEETVFAENRLSIYGGKATEWNSLATWFATYGVASPNNKWVIQIPRLYPAMKRGNPNSIHSFADLLKNIFEPLWEVTLRPALNPKLHHFLTFVCAFDSVDDESIVDSALTPMMPQLWTTEENPPYNYWCYFLWANIHALNEVRAERKFSTFAFRPHCGEGGSWQHLIGGFLAANSINHGINLRLSSPLQYLYYLTQIPLTMSPLSNNMLFLDYKENPFPLFFHRGLKVTLSTDDPLFFHHTQEPLIEEYSVAAKVWRLDPNDMNEIARNSVLMSGFPHEWKKKCLGDVYFLSSERANNETLTHLSDVRVAYRYDQYHDEVAYLESLTGGLTFPRAMLTWAEEADMIQRISGALQLGVPSLLIPDPPSSCTKSIAGTIRELSRNAAMIAQANDNASGSFRKELSGGDMLQGIPTSVQVTAEGSSGSGMYPGQQPTSTTLANRLRIHPFYNRGNKVFV